MISSQSPYSNPSGLSAQGLSEGQLSDAAQYFLANLQRLLNANLENLKEVCWLLLVLIRSLTATETPLHIVSAMISCSQSVYKQCSIACSSKV